VLPVEHPVKTGRHVESNTDSSDGRFDESTRASETDLLTGTITIFYAAVDATEYITENVGSDVIDSPEQVDDVMNDMVGDESLPLS
jgi:hypothetical protein